MTEQEAREYIAEAFSAANVRGLLSYDSSSEIMKMKDDIKLIEFAIDSLAVMEICISIEVNTGVTITPAKLLTVPSIKTLISMLMERA